VGSRGDAGTWGGVCTRALNEPANEGYVDNSQDVHLFVAPFVSLFSTRANILVTKMGGLENERRG
jgi:hypothetical protein